MRLWNDYEGNTIAGIYPIEKLLRPEGRSAFFSTSNGTGTPAVIRLIESLNDEYEILPRWKVMAELKQTHLVTLKKYGQTTFEGTPLLYAVMEATDADLSQILCERSLSVDETREIATSLVEALETLHGAGFVHEHIEPASVQAKGDVVKLRSDCVREAPEGDEGIALKKQDIHDLAVVLLQALTLQRSLDAIGPAALPAPFDKVIRNGINGTWGLAQMAAVLMPPVAAVTAAPVVPAASASSPTAEQLPLAIPEVGAASAPDASVKTAPAPTERAAPKIVLPKPSSRPDRIEVPVEHDLTRQRLWVVVSCVAVLLVMILGWKSMHKSPQASAASQPITTLADVNQPKGTASTAPTTAAAVPVAAPAAAASDSRPVATVDRGRPWRLVVYTYNHQDQAQHKADQLAQRNAELRPEVFSPTGRAPYLVTLGGAMTREDAASFEAKVVGNGLPHDMYIQNYTGRSR